MLGKAQSLLDFVEFSAVGVFVSPPFKPQNMALNSAVTIDGGEIGRAQALQAVACGIEPHSDMNPILLKPNSATGAQVIVQGKVLSNMDARGYHRFKPEAMPFVMQSFERLEARARTHYRRGRRKAPLK